MRFLLSEYINLLKEDGELDALITDLLVGMKFIPISKPQRGRQYGVDVAATGIDETDGKLKIFLFVVKQGNLTRTSWDGNVNAVRSSLNQVQDTFIPISLTKSQRALPIKVIVCTNGDLDSNVRLDWARYVDKNSTKKIKYEFWGTNEISAKIDEYLVSEKLFPEEYQSLLRKTLAFLDLPDYDLSHFYQLIELILSKQARQKRQILKKQRLVRLCLNIIYKWSQDIQNLKPSIFASEKCLLLSWHFLQTGDHLNKAYALQEFYKIHLLKRVIGVTYFNKVHKHYQTDFSLYRYSRNSLEYSLNVWQEIGILANIGLTEVQEFRIHKDDGNIELAERHYKSAISIGNALGLFIEKNPPSKYPEYDEHCIEIALALNLLYITKNPNKAKNWIGEMAMGFSDRYRIEKFFPIFRTNYDKLLDVHNREEECEIQSSMIIPLLAEYALVFKEEGLYHFLRKIIKEVFTELDLQIWFPTQDMEKIICIQDYSRGEGKTKNTVILYEDVEKYKKELIEEIELFGNEKNFQIFKAGFDTVAYVASRHNRSQPFPLTWRTIIKSQNLSSKLDEKLNDNEN